MDKLIKNISQVYPDNKKIAEMFKNGIENTYLTTLKTLDDGSVFVITGDIPAMWLRDSTAQVRPLLYLTEEDPEIRKLIKGVIKTQQKQILIDPYANAFNASPNSQGHQEDQTEMKPWIWERKYEVDSLCYHLQLAYLYWKSCDDQDIFDETFIQVVKTILEVWTKEQDHHRQSSYRFQRDVSRLNHQENLTLQEKYESLPNQGMGTPLAYTGMTWSAFRPSDDACQYGYLVPSNMFAVVVLDYLVEILQTFYDNKNLIDQVTKLREAIHKGIQEYGIVETETYGRVYAYEVDGLGNHLLMDDANVPSLLSAPYLGYCDLEDPIYQNTRKMVLSAANPFYYQGTYAEGIGSPHTPDNYIWHIGLGIQGMTATNDQEKDRILEYLTTTDADTLFMHEGFDVDNPYNFTRPWFSWANSIFAEFILSLNGHYVKASPLDKNK